jgi:glycosyltransferase involved in cell wall biosynthesis
MARSKLLIEYQKVPYGKMILYYISGFFLTIYVVLKYKCSLIHTHWAIPTGLISILTGALLRRPFVVTIHGSDFRLATEKSKFLRTIFIWICKKARHITCVSKVQEEEIEKMEIQKEKIWTFPMGIDESFLEVGKNREKKPYGQPYTIISNRSLLSIYNVSLLIRAIPMVLKEESNTQFLIAGDGPERKNLQQEARDLDLGPTVRFIGRISHEKMPSLLAQADIYVSTSLHDGTSVSLLEAMGSGAFPVVTDIPSNREWISDGDNGFLVPKEDENLLAKKIVEAIRNHRLLGEASTKNQEIVEQRAYWRENLKKITELYQNSL